MTKQRVQLGLRENAGDLRGQGDQEGLFAFVKLAQFALLHNQHAEQLTPLDNRHAEEGAKTALFYCGNVFKAGVLLRVGEVNGFRQAAHQAHQTFVKSERNDAPAGLFQPARRHQVITASVIVSQINRTDFRLHRGADIGDQDIQRLV